MKLPIPGPQISPPRPSGQTYSPQPSIQSALEMEIPADRIARKINEMIEATRETSSGSVESDWTTVEAGLRLYLEFTKRPMPPGISLPETSSGTPAVPSPVEWQGKPNRQKQPLPRQNEDAGTLRNFMIYSPPALADEASGWEKEGTEFSIQGWQRRPPTPDPVAPSGPAPVNRSAPWLSMLCALITISGLVIGVTFLSSKPNLGQGDHQAPLQIVGSSEVLSPEMTAPAAARNASVPSNATPGGWANRKQYDEWTPKFEASLNDE